MAIDSRIKRESALFFGRHHTIHPDGVIDAGDRQDILGFYRGILAPEPTVIPPYMDVMISVPSYDVGITVT